MIFSNRSSQMGALKAFALGLAMAGLSVGCGSGGSSSSQAGIEVSVNARLSQSAGSDSAVPVASAGEKQFVNTEGTDIVLSKAYLVLWSVELETNCGNNQFVDLLQRIGGFLISSAEAHSDEAPNLFSEPHVINILGEENTQRLGAINPSANTYCGVSVEMLNADADANNLPADVDMMNKSLYLEGTYQLAGSDTPQSFQVSTGKSLLTASRLFSPALSLDSANLSSDITVKIVYDRWFDGVDVSRISEDAYLDLLLNNVSGSIVLY